MGRTKNILLNNRYANNSSFFAKPWFVAIVVFGCFGILTPKIFLPLFRQLFGLNQLQQRFGGSSDDIAASSPTYDRSSPYLRARQHGPPVPPPVVDPPTGGGEYARPGPQFARHNSYMQPSGGGGGGKSLLNYLLPVYAIGIGIYMIYTLSKVFGKNDEKKGENKCGSGEEYEEGAEETDYDDILAHSGSVTTKFRERQLLENNPAAAFRWDANEGEFKYTANKPGGGHHFAKGEETEDEQNDYERYKNLDPEYVEYLKQRRRARRCEGKGLTSPYAKFPPKEKQQPNGAKLAEPEEIPLTPNIGLTSITNTNLLMNDTLERMKYSLNKINNQLLTFEKKGVPLDDPEMESLRLQLNQTELQMARIMSIVSSVSDTIEAEKTRIITTDQSSPPIPQLSQPHLQQQQHHYKGQKLLLNKSRMRTTTMTTTTASNQALRKRKGGGMPTTFKKSTSNSSSHHQQQASRKLKSSDHEDDDDDDDDDDEDENVDEDSDDSAEQQRHGSAQQQSASSSSASSRSGSPSVSLSSRSSSTASSSSAESDSNKSSKPYKPPNNQNHDDQESSD